MLVPHWQGYVAFGSPPVIEQFGAAMGHGKNYCTISNKQPQKQQQNTTHMNCTYCMTSAAAAATARHTQTKANQREHEAKQSATKVDRQPTGSASTASKADRQNDFI